MEDRMGYFEGVTSSSFKITEDGRRLFFPWGTLGRGYVLRSEEDYRRLLAQVKAFMVVSFALILVPNLLRAYVLAATLTIVPIGFYGVWMWLLLRRLEVADERLSFQESMTSQARAHGAAVLWLMAVGSLLLALGGLFLLITKHEKLLGSAATAFFGLCAVAFVFMLILRSRTADA
ncbi:hypothetical protein QA645_22280 [Bradyrhizobium sp. CIAT3101]|uniref:hypothetical protein n=1 Tax=Bradyrhizobium sp. CIAT3101 TaxID=439387 RepID=UPI0024B0FF87|nr:hypothetical protein [Bradyrhizobium sp. CIAT3101]WFU77289.1 hypothetical protein QA645_22280 [Bradyrhizobium sp. CIAT3101]